MTISRSAALRMADILDMDLPRLGSGFGAQDVLSMSGSPLSFSEDGSASSDGLSFSLREGTATHAVRRNVRFDGVTTARLMRAFVSGPGFNNAWIASGDASELMAWCEAFRRGWRPDNWVSAGVPKAAVEAAGPSTYDARMISNRRRLARQSAKRAA